MIEDYEEEFEGKQRPNKSQIKRDIQAFADLAKKLVQMPESTWPDMQLSPLIQDEIRIYKNTPQHGAQKRQMKYLVKMLQSEDLTSAREMIENQDARAQQMNATFHRVELWRDRLIAEGQEALTEFLKEVITPDIQHLRQLILQAKKESAQGKMGKAGRQLFKTLRDLLGA